MAADKKDSQHKLPKFQAIQIYKSKNYYLEILTLGNLSKLELTASFNSWLRLLALKSTIEVFYSERAEAAGRLQKSCWFWVRVPGRSRARTRKRWSADLTEEPKKKEFENYIACIDAQGQLGSIRCQKSSFQMTNWLF